MKSTKGYLLHTVLGVCILTSLWKSGWCLQMPKLTFLNRNHQHWRMILFAQRPFSSSDVSPSPSTLATITIPQYYRESCSPIHERPYPSPLHKIHIAPILTPEQASTCLQYARNHAEETKCWDAKDTERHVSYSTADFPLEDCPAMQEYLDELDFESRIFSLLSELYSVDVDDLEFLDLLCSLYW